MSQYDALQSWATANGAYLNPKVAIAVSPTTGASFVASEEIPRSEPIVSCPMRLSLSYLNVLEGAPADFINPWTTSPPGDVANAGNRPARVKNIPLPADFLASTPPHVVSRFLLMQQYLAGSQSYWNAYINALPQPGELQLPVFWDSDDTELLDGTNLGASVVEIRTRLADEYAAARKLLTGWTEGGWREFSRELYSWAYGIFTSRSFTPLLVIPKGVQAALAAPLGGRRMDEFSLLLPLYDVGNHDMTVPVTWTPLDAGENDGGLSRVTLTVDRVHAKGTQVFNNYGMRTNSQLLLSYGFMIPESETLHNDYVHLKKRNQKADVTHDYILSLHPATDQRSVLLEHRQMVKAGRLEALSNRGKHEVLSSFQRVQDEIVYDLVLMHASLDKLGEKLGVQADLQTDDSIKQEVLARLLTKQVPDDVRPWLLQTMAVIGAQAMVALEKLDETEVEVDEDQMPHLTQNQRLGLGYRKACRRVLENVLEAIDTRPVEDGGEEEEEE
ncbi:Ribosomal N-lysine methyltransferase set10 [Ceratocystis platani]|uniref:Ribosomal N-lysine methyltransferase set10 n=1 Tax=Ceratocystis fimbriata f. sp. platani TaxID=88771 RepID=A0A0F8D9G6_CERFI|nr:Ribosomal N-lysine methyltransferase set10 [Ceratocystis platani]